MLRTFAIPLILLCAAAPLSGADQGLFNLAEKPSAPRFEVTGRTWPAQVGEPSLCLWHDDKLAATSITIDDNNAVDFDWWKEQAGRHDFRATWFLITGRVDGPNAYFGTWKGYGDLRAAGHAIESHTVAHLHNEEPGWGGIEWEYAESIRQIERGIPGHRVGFLAYPGGPNSKLNDREVAARLFLAARGTRGTINPANRIDYLDVCAMSSLSIGNPKASWADIENLFNPEDKNAYRGWSVHVFHKVNKPEEAARLFEFASAHRDDLWVGLFGDVARYGQQRDTATLTPGVAEPSRITFALADRMDDRYYDFPLTVKVRLPDAWKGAVAEQGGRPVALRTVAREGAAYALVQAVPDRGEVVLRPAGDLNASAAP